MGSDALIGLEFANLSKIVQTISYPPASASQVLCLAGSLVNISKEVVEGIKHMSQRPHLPGTISKGWWLSIPGENPENEGFNSERSGNDSHNKVSNPSTMPWAKSNLNNASISFLSGGKDRPVTSGKCPCQHLPLPTAGLRGPRSSGEWTTRLSVFSTG